MRLLMWLLLGVLVYLALRKKAASSSPTNLSQDFPSKAKEATTQGENMVCCAACQVFVPSSEAIMHEEKYYCSIEHVQQT